MPLLIAKHGSDTQTLGTISAFRSALELGAHGLYIDVILSSEGEVILSLPSKVPKTYKQSVKVANGITPPPQPLAESISAGDAEDGAVSISISKSPPLTPAAICQLIFSDKDKLLYIKVDDTVQSVIPKLIRQLMHLSAGTDNGSSTIVVEMDQSAALKTLKENYPEIQIARRFNAKITEDEKLEMLQLDPDFVTLSVEHATENMITQMHRKAIRVIADLKEELSQQALVEELTRALKFRFDGVITSQLKLTQSVISGSASLNSAWQDIEKNLKPSQPVIENSAKKSWTDRLS